MFIVVFMLVQLPSMPNLYIYILYIICAFLVIYARIMYVLTYTHVSLTHESYLITVFNVHYHRLNQPDPTAVISAPGSRASKRNACENKRTCENKRGTRGY